MDHVRKVDFDPLILSYLTMASDSESSSSRPTASSLSQVTIWYCVLDWPEDGADTVTLDSTANVASLRKAIAPNVLDPFRPEKPVHVTDIDIWQVCRCVSEKRQMLTHMTQLKFAHVHEVADGARWAKLVTDYGKKLSEFATYVDQSASISEILPRRTSDKPLLNLIVVRKRQRKRVSDSGVENEEEDQLAALNVYSKRQPPSPSPCITALTHSQDTFRFGTLRNPRAQKLHQPPLRQRLSESRKRGSIRYSMDAIHLIQA